MSVILSDNFPHPDANGENTISLTGLNVVATDTDGDPASATVSITVIDDIPDAVADLAKTVAEDAAGTIGGNLLTNDTQGADGAAVISVTIGGVTTAVAAGGTTIVTTNGTYVINAGGVAGAWTFDPNSNLVNNLADIDASFSYTLRDGDGDLDPAVQPITITDGANPTSTKNASITVNEEGIDNGNAKGSVNNNSENDSDTVSFQAGSDNITAIAFGDVAGLTVDVNGILGPDIAWTRVSGTQITGSIGGILAITINLNPPALPILAGASGSATVSVILSDNFPHPDANGENTISLTGLNVVATDTDGDPASATVSITVIDDIPDAVADLAKTVAEDAAGTIGGNLLTNDTQGADGAAVISVTIGGVTTAVAAGGTTIVTTNGTYVINAGGVAGAWTFDPNSNLVNNLADIDASFSYTLRDGDGDLDPAVQPITITDGANPTSTKNAVIALDEEGLGTPNATGTNPTATSESASDTVSFTAGSDNIASVVFGLTAGITLTDYAGPAIVWSPGGGNTVTGTIGGIVAITLSLSSVTTGASGGATVTATLSDNFLHLSGAGENSLSISGVAVVATDIDGDTASASVALTVKDDIPLAVQPKATAMTNAAGATGGNFLDDDNDVDNDYGADGGKLLFTSATVTSLLGQNLTSGFSSLAYSISPDGTLLTATKTVLGVTSTVFTVALQPVGLPDQYVVTMSQPLDSAQTVDFNGGGYNFVGGNGSWAGFTQPLVANSDDVLLTPIGGGTVNTNANEGGVATGNSVGSGELMRVDFVKDLVGSPVSGGDFYAGDDTQSFTGHYTVNGAGALFTSINTSSTISLKAFDDADTGTLKNVGDGVADAINKISISHGVVTQLITANGTYVIDGISYTVTFSGGIVTVGGVADNTRIAGFTATGFNSIEFGFVSGNTFKIGDFGASVIKNQPVNFTVPVTITDNDGDAVPSGSLVIALNPVAGPAPLSVTEFALPGETMLFSLDQELEQSGAATAPTSRFSGTQMTAVETASPSSASLATTGKTVEQARNNTNVTATVIAASLVGLPAMADAVTAAAPDDAHLAMLPDMESAMPDRASLVSGEDTETLVNQPDTVTETEFASLSGDSDSSLQAVDDSDLPTGLTEQPVSPISDALTGGADVVSIGDIVPTAAPMGGDAVMHSILDLAAANVTVASNDNPAAPALENVVDEALPDTMVDRLIDAFEGDDGAPVISSDSGSDSSGYLVELINQSVSNSSDLVTINVDPFGSQFNDMATANNG